MRCSPFDASIPLADHQRAGDYTLAKGQFGKIDAAGLMVTALILFGGLSRSCGR